MRLHRWAGIALLVLSSRAFGQVQSAAQQRCISALERGGALVARVGAQRFVRCVTAAGRGRLPRGQTAEQCLATDEGGRLAGADERMASRAARVCIQTPDFGPTTAAAVNEAFGTMLHVHALFGDDLDAAVIPGRRHRRRAACQAAVARGIASIAAARLDEFHACTTAGLRSGTIRSATDLAGCYGADPRGRIARAVRNAQGVANRKCAGMSVAETFPGECARTPLAELLGCADRRIACDTCMALDAAAGVAQVCQQYRDGVAAPYCGTRPATTQSVARQWNEEMLDAIRHDTPRPPVHARNLFHVSVAMYDAWTAYDPIAAGYLTRQKLVSDDPAVDRDTAISFAGYRVLTARYAHSPGAAGSLASFDARMAALGYDASFTATEGDSAAALGNRIAAAVLAHGLADGANEEHDYADTTGYSPINDPLIVKLPGTVMNDPNRWQPLALDLIVAQNGIQLPDKVQTFIGAQWELVRPFALTRPTPDVLYIDPGPPPQLGGVGDAEYKDENLSVIRFSSWLDPSDGATIDLSPGVHGNTTLGTDQHHGYPVNPVTGQPYAPNVVKRADWGRVIAEFWADGPNSETPPGHWNVIANYVSDQPGFQKRIDGMGPVLDDLEWDVKLYLALNAAEHDAAIACWSLKRKYDSVRPISAIRYMGKKGQSGCASQTPGACMSVDPMGTASDPEGLPLEPGLVEVNGHPNQRVPGHDGEIVIYAWPGSPADPTLEFSGAKWIRAVEWVPYQKKTFVTPAFPGYNSGHSTYSRAGAEVLTRFTGSAFFPGGLGEFVAARNRFLSFELGPTDDVVLQWATYYDAADEAGMSRRWGGIHIEADDFTGRMAGSKVGAEAHDLARRYFAGTAGP